MHCHVVGLRAYVSTEGKRGHALAVNVTSRAALVMNSLNHQKTHRAPSVQPMREHRAEGRASLSRMANGVWREALAGI